MLFCLTHFHHVTEDQKLQINIHCDNKQAVTMASTTTPPINISETTVAEYDIQKLIHHIKMKTPIQIKYKWIKKNR